MKQTSKWIEDVLADVARRESEALERTEELGTITTLFGCDYYVGESGAFVGGTSVMTSVANELVETVVPHPIPLYRKDTWQEEEEKRRKEIKEQERIRDEARYQRWLERMKEKYDL